MFRKTTRRFLWRLLFPWTVMFLLALASVSAVGQEHSLSAGKRAQIEKAVSAFMTANSVPGVSIAIVENGQSVWSAGFGLADLEDSAPATSSTLYRLGSISKSITAVAVLQLYERGKLDVDAPVQKYCPAFPQKDSPITSRQLLAHLSGIRHYNDDGKGDVPEDSARHFATMEDSLQLFASDPLLSKPGTQFHYSTYGYTLLGCVLEGAASQKYSDFVRENVFRPAAMDHSQADDFFAIIPIAPAGITKTNLARFATPAFSTPATKFPAEASSPPPTTWPISRPPFSPTSS